MQNMTNQTDRPDYDDSDGKPIARGRIHIGVSTTRLVMVAVIVALIMWGLDLPFVQTYVTNRVAGNEVTSLGHWVLLMLTTLVLVWNFLRNQAKVSALGKLSTLLCLGLAWAVVVGWRANDRFNLNDAYNQLDIIWNVLIVAGVLVILVVGLLNIGVLRQWWNERRTD